MTSLGIGVLPLMIGVLSLTAFNPRALLTALAPAILVALGLWYTTTANPADHTTESPYSPRRIARFTLLVAATGELLGAFLRATWPAVAHPLLVHGLFSPLGLAGLVFVYAYTRYFELLAAVCGDRFSSGRAALYRRGYVVGWALIAPGALLLLATMRPPGPAALPLVLMALVGVALILICGVLVSLLPTYLANRIKESLGEADAPGGRTGVLIN